MKKILVLCSIIMFSEYCFSLDLPADAKILVASQDIEDAKKVSEALDDVTSAVMSCIKNNTAEPAKCACMFPDQVSALQSAYKTALSKHPDWKDKLVHYANEANSYSYNISFLGLRNQLEHGCD